MVADHAAGDSAQLAMPRHVAGDPADDGSFDTALGSRIRRASKRNCDHAKRRKNPSHGSSPILMTDFNATAMNYVPSGSNARCGSMRRKYQANGSSSFGI